MAHQMYSHQQNPPPQPLPPLQLPIPNFYSSTARSTLDSNYLTNPPSYSHLPTPSFYYPSSTSLYSSSYADRAPSAFLPSSDAAPAPAPAPASASAASLWPSFDVSSVYSKRPSPALYTHSTLGTHTLGQSEAWLTSDTFAKRPKLESTFSLPVYPQRPGEKECTHYMLTRTCRFGDSCKFDHPIWVPDSGIPDWKETTLASVPSESHPERPGEPDCPYYLKTQKCKFGLNCKFNHPKNKLCTSGKTDAGDLPERPSEPLCSFYVKTGKCKFGATCKFHHPKDIQIPSDGQEAINSEKIKSAGNVIPSNYRNDVKTFISDPAPSCNFKGLPMRLGEVDCPFYMKTGSCKYAANCRYNHPDRNIINPPAAGIGHSVLTSSIPNLPVGLFNPASSILQNFQHSLPQTTFGPSPVLYPQRPGQKECDYYMKVGVCKYGESCKFHHPIDRSAHKSVDLTLAGLPRRKDATNCPFYMKTGTCKYGATCKFDHPPPGEVIALAGKENSATSEEVKDGDNAENPGE